MCLATDRDQARIVLNYIRSYFSDIPMLAGMIERETADGFELSNQVDIAVSTNSFRAVRGRPILCAILDECAFWRDDASANPDAEIYNAVRPGTATMPSSIIVGISSPYRRKGLLHDKFKRNYGKPGSALVIRAPTAVLIRRSIPKVSLMPSQKIPLLLARNGWRSFGTISLLSLVRKRSTPVWRLTSLNGRA
jgi:hypothetical protein